MEADRADHSVIVARAPPRVPETIVRVDGEIARAQSGAALRSDFGATVFVAKGARSLLREAMVRMMWPVERRLIASNALSDWLGEQALHLDCGDAGCRGG